MASLPIIPLSVASFPSIRQQEDEGWWERGVSSGGDSSTCPCTVAGKPPEYGSGRRQRTHGPASPTCCRAPLRRPPSEEQLQEHSRTGGAGDEVRVQGLLAGGGGAPLTHRGPHHHLHTLLRRNPGEPPISLLLLLVLLLLLLVLLLKRKTSKETGASPLCDYLIMGGLHNSNCGLLNFSCGEFWCRSMRSLQQPCVEDKAKTATVAIAVATEAKNI